MAAVRRVTAPVHLPQGFSTSNAKELVSNLLMVQARVRIALFQPAPICQLLSWTRRFLSNAVVPGLSPPSLPHKNPALESAGGLRGPGQGGVLRGRLPPTQAEEPPTASLLICVTTKLSEKFRTPHFITLGRKISKKKDDLQHQG